jgi:hypothetical protein
MQAFVAGDFYTRSSRPARLLASRHAGFLREYDVFTDIHDHRDIARRGLNRGSLVLPPPCQGRLFSFGVAQDLEDAVDPDR